MEQEENIIPIEEQPSEETTIPTEEVVEEPVVENTEIKEETPVKLSRRKKRRLKWLGYDPEHDIKYRGPLSYRALRILAWLFLAISQIGAFLTLASNVDAGLAAKLGSLDSFLSAFKSMMMPLFLMATFSLLLNKSRKFSSLLFMYGGFAFLFFLLFILIHDRYAIGLFMKMMETDRTTARITLDSLISSFSSTGYLTYNIFIDLFFCTLFVCFLTYKPKRIFTGKKLIIFRLFALLPVGYELACIILKGYASVGLFTMPTYMYPFLPTKPPMTFLVFIVLTSYLTLRGRIYAKHGLSNVEYDEFLKSNRNSWSFSAFTSCMIALAAIVDLILMIVVGACCIKYFPAEEMSESFSQSIAMAQGLGIGQSAPMILIIPFVLLFSYTRTHKDGRIDIIIPIVGIVLLALIYLEEVYQLLLFGLDKLAGMFAE